MESVFKHGQSYLILLNSKTCKYCGTLQCVWSVQLGNILFWLENGDHKFGCAPVPHTHTMDRIGSHCFTFLCINVIYCCVGFCASVFRFNKGYLLSYLRNNDIPELILLNT